MRVAPKLDSIAVFLFGNMIGMSTLMMIQDAL